MDIGPIAPQEGWNRCMMVDAYEKVIEGVLLAKDS